MKTALLIAGGWNGHEPMKCAEIAAEILRKEGFKTEISDSLDSLRDEARMQSLSLVVPVWTMGSLGNEQGKGLMDAVKAGVGIAGWHGGMGDSFRENTEYQFMTGGQFVAHPGSIQRYKVNIVKPQDPIMKGIPDFEMTSEQYYMHVDPGNEVLATTTFGGDFCPWIKCTVMPVVWKRMFGKGKVFYMSTGHVADDFKVPELREIIRRGMLWSAR